MNESAQRHRHFLKERFAIQSAAHECIVALAGNPNVGKSTIFNALTGLHQHTGNWPGKTVGNAQGTFTHEHQPFLIVDLPGTYSILSQSAEEEIARNFLCFAQPDAVLVVLDSSCLERNLNLALQIIEITPKVVVCVNLLDEAAHNGITVHLDRLRQELGVPVVGTTARTGAGLQSLKENLLAVAGNTAKLQPKSIRYTAEIEDAVREILPELQNIPDQRINKHWLAMRLLEGEPTLIHSIAAELGHPLAAACAKAATIRLENQNKNFTDLIVSNLYSAAHAIAQKTVTAAAPPRQSWQTRLDDICTSRLWGYPLMLLLLCGVFWLTIKGANYPSALLAQILFGFQDQLTQYFQILHAPAWLHGLLILGMYRSLAWVISVMLPPMAIFFPLFTLLEDLGYLPRVAFNMDCAFKKCCASGKQVLTMCMGFGCNAAGIVACRIIDSPRERLIALLTNNFVPCNGRFPTLIAISTIFIAGLFSPEYSTVITACSISAIVLLGIAITFAVSWGLSHTMLKGEASTNILELPPYRMPQFGAVIYRSVMDRTLFVLNRAMLMAAPAGAMVWLLANVMIGETSILLYMAHLLDPMAWYLGLDGVILLAFILGLPANEIVVPILLMTYLSTGQMIEAKTLYELESILIANGWTWLTAVSTMLFCLLHWPCSTALLTAYKESGSIKWTFIAFALPTAVGICACFLLSAIVRLAGLV